MGMNKPSIARIETNVEVVLASYEKCEIGNCDGCAFEHIRRDWPAACAFYQQESARYLLKRLKDLQSARLMTLEEVEKWIETPEERKDPIFVEYGKKMKFGRSGWRTGFFGFSPQHDTHSYGTVLRCWTSRPTEEQREAVTWE